MIWMCILGGLLYFFQGALVVLVMANNLAKGRGASYSSSEKAVILILWPLLYLLAFMICVLLVPVILCRYIMVGGK